MSVDVRAAGTSALMLTFGSLAEAVAFRAGLRTATGSTASVAGVTEVVSGARTLLVRFDPRVTDAVRLRAALADVRPREVDPSGSGAAVVVRVTYDGADLEEVARLAGTTPAGLVAWHTGQVWTSAFCGFAPGFSYLTGSAPSLDVPRRSAARTAVPSGSVGLAGGFSGVYPRTSPGGWQLIGRTDVPMWSVDRDPPALAPAGTRVRFVDAGAA